MNQPNHVISENLVISQPLYDNDQAAQSIYDKYLRDCSLIPIRLIEESKETQERPFAGTRQSSQQQQNQRNGHNVQEFSSLEREQRNRNQQQTKINNINNIKIIKLDILIRICIIIKDNRISCKIIIMTNNSIIIKIEETTKIIEWNKNIMAIIK
ncbi:unnamed protein product (macronuclear) [Paramecium tetraurelia]|uniref:Uncharacterized protein n=1 Tax=Paramecium tetraurelia TaxID=5888 RepID=A0BUM7_PARTE|nr:uncharacterized protein GSPATT00005490001 [Paramecium tetraurelia]CAK62244.1 unnamed protein product [Paramecium tetraurelia]|eukprot:XP_001429642.1 hypothetical protein (macronuclear) [Paramecium tetraurelia strain d4-2]